MSELVTSMTDFYQKNRISPVRQNISDWIAHAERREALFRQLGILPAFIRGRTVLEVGPGSGFNSLYTATLAPQRLVLLEGNLTGIADIEALFSRFNQLNDRIELVSAFLEDFRIQEQFDFVFCEGVLGALGIANPGHLFEQLMGFVAPGGVLVITWRIYGPDKAYNQRALDHYWQNVHNLLDCSQVLPPRQLDQNRRLYHFCTKTRQAIQRFELSRHEEVLPEVEQALEQVIDAVAEFSAETASALSEAYTLLTNRPFDVQSVARSEKFGGLFGRGQQYLSLSHRAPAVSLS